MSARAPAAWRRPLLIAATIVVVDQATKVLAHASLRGRGPVEIVPGLFNLWYSTNPGGLFGLFREWPAIWRMLLLTLLPVAAVALIVLFLMRVPPADRWTRWGLTAILGGAGGNLIDRLARGHVVDFLDVYASPEPLAGWLVERFGTAHWPTFNVADSAIVVGAGMLIVEMLTGASSAARSRQPEGQGEGEPG